MNEELKVFAAEVTRHFDVVGEALRSEIRQLAEGLEHLNEKVERGFLEAKREFDEVKAMIKFSHGESSGRSCRS